MVYCISPHLIRMLYAADGSSSVFIEWASVIEALKIIVPVLGAWLAAYLAGRRDDRKERRQFEAQQTDKLTTGWSEIVNTTTAQSREIIASLQDEVVKARAHAVVVEEQLSATREELNDAKEELEALRLSFDQVKKDYTATLEQLRRLEQKRRPNRP